MGNNDSSFTDIPAQNMSPLHADFASFHHQDLLTASDAEKPWKQEKLVNILNHLNFIDGFIYLVISDKQNGKSFLAKAYPLPCVKDELLCRLTSPGIINNISNYKFDFLMIDDGLTTVLAPVQLISAENDIIKLSLPDHSHVKKLRKTRRHKCENIDCLLFQDGCKVEGSLIDFTPTAISINILNKGSWSKFDQSKPVEINISNNHKIIYSGSYLCIRNSIDFSDRRVIFSFINKQTPLFPKRDVRNSREILKPNFVIKFKHPIFNKNISRDIFDISTSGFSIQDSTDEELLIPGMFIPEICIIYAGVVNINCSSQVVYRQENQQNKTIKCGLAIIDMSIKDCTVLNHILGTYLDSYAHFSTKVDLDALWDFFFDTGFIYGNKYEHLHTYRNTFTDTYKKIYCDNPDIARHFIYQNNGAIFGHIAMLHVYPPSWLIHHFSARKMGNLLPGNSVLKQINQFIRSYNRLPSAGMTYVMTYYRPNNKIIDRIFGRFTRNLNDFKKSSLDTFSYFLFEKKSYNYDTLNSKYILRKANEVDISILNKFYESFSGGLFIESLGLDNNIDLIKSMFTKAGLKRDLNLYCLISDEKHIAFFIINQSDLGLNLSDLMNSIKIIILDQEMLPFKLLLNIINDIAKVFPENKIPLLIYPSNYLSSHNIIEEKQYTLWIVNTYSAVEDYLSYMDKLLKLQHGNQ